MTIEIRGETRTERLARLREAWRTDRTKMTAEDIGWLLDVALTAQESGVTLCQDCARELTDPLKEECWFCTRDADFEGGPFRELPETEA